MKTSSANGVLRPLIAVMTTIAFVFSPFAAVAQQKGDPAAKDGADEQAQPAKPAGPTPKLFLLPTQGVQDDISGIIPERIGEMLRGQLQGKRSIELLPTYDKLQKQGGGRANAAVAEAKRLYTSGIGLLTAGEDDKAAKTFQKAVDIMEQNIADLQNFDVLADAYKNMALAYKNAGYDFDSRKRMKVFACLRPEATLDKEKFPKELREVFNDEVKKIKRAGPGKLVIKADVGAALVYIDGVSKGKTPTTVEDVGYGYHYMVVRAPNGGVWSEQIRVRGRGKTQKFDVELGAGGAQADAEQSGDAEGPAFYTGLLGGIKSGSFGKDLQPYLAELVTRTGTQYVAWVAMVKKGREYMAVPFIYRAEDGLMIQADSVSFNIELSNLRVGVSQLASTIVATADTMPEDQAITSVDLTASEEKAPVAAAATGGEQGGEQAGEQAGGEAVATNDQTGEAGETTAAGSEAGEEAATHVTQKEQDSVEPPPVPSDKEGETDKWVWIGAGSAAVLVTGLVVGGVVYMTDSGSDQPKNFDATLSW